MRNYSLRAIVKTVLRGAAVLLIRSGHRGCAQTTVNLTAVPSNPDTPDGASVPMWGYSCGAVPAAAHAAPRKRHGRGWSPVILTVPTGSRPTDRPDQQPADSQTAMGSHVGRDRWPTRRRPGDKTQRTHDSPDHSGAQGDHRHGLSRTTATPGYASRRRAPRVQSFARKWLRGQARRLRWRGKHLSPGTYLLESGTHPSIQATMGLIGMLVVTNAPARAPGTAYPAAALLRRELRRGGAAAAERNRSSAEQHR